MLTVIHNDKDQVQYAIDGCTYKELENRFHLFFSSEGYRLRSAGSGKHIYEKGNRLLRNLFGAFFKYYRQRLIITSDRDKYSVIFQKDLSGISGGLIREKQVNREFSRLNEAFQYYFRN